MTVDGGRKVPQAAYAEEYDENEDEVMPQSRVQASINRSSISKLANSKNGSQTQQQPGPASDSGYSSVHSGLTANTNDSSPTMTARPPARTAYTDSASSKSTATIKREDIEKPKSSRSQPQATTSCSDPKCRDSACGRPKDRRRTNASDSNIRPSLLQTALPPSQHYANQTQTPPQPYVQPATPVDDWGRRNSFTARQRPVSFHGGYPANGTYNAIPQLQRGPPPSPSAYMNPQPTYGPPGGMPAVALNYSIPPYHAVPIASHVQQQPMQAPPMYNTRQPAYDDYSTRRPPPPMVRRSSSVAPSTRVPVRQTSRPRHSSRPPRKQYSESDSASESSYDSASDSSTSSREHYERRRTRKLERDSRRMPPPAVPQRRPTFHERYTEPLTQPVQLSRSALRRSRDMNQPLEYDLPIRPASDHQDPHYVTQSRIRHPGDEHLVRSTPRGQADYFPPTAGREIQAEAYMRMMNGGEGDELTADRIRQQAKGPIANGPKTYVSRRSSTRSTRSKSDGIKIRNGDTYLHVIGNATINVEDDGATLHIGGPSSRESQNGSVYSYGSRSGMRRERVDPREVHEDGYERAL